MKQLYERIHGLGYKIKITKRAKEQIVEKGWDPQFGARPLKRAIQKYVEDVLAEELIKHKLSEDDTIHLDYDAKKDEMTVKITERPAAGKKK